MLSNVGETKPYSSLHQGEESDIQSTNEPGSQQIEPGSTQKQQGEEDETEEEFIVDNSQNGCLFILFRFALFFWKVYLLQKKKKSKIEESESLQMLVVGVVLKNHHMEKHGYYGLLIGCFIFFILLLDRLHGFGS